MQNPHKSRIRLDARGVAVDAGHHKVWSLPITTESLCFHKAKALLFEHY
jgi:hypothetical protein